MAPPPPLPKGFLWGYGLRKEHFAGDLAVAGGVVYAATYEGGLLAIDLETGKRLWDFQAGPRFGTSPSLADGAVYVGGGGGQLYRLDAATGTVRWQLALEGHPVGAPVEAGETIYVATREGILYAIR